MAKSEAQLNDQTKARLAKEKRRRELRYKIMDCSAVYLSVVLGVLVTQSALDIQETQRLNIFSSWSPARFIVAAIIAAGFMVNFERCGDAVGKKRNLWRRCSHAFGQGAALRGIIEWLSVLFILAR